MDTGRILENRNASLVVYEQPERDVIPPFLVGEVAGSLSIGSDRKQLREFAVTILGWLERTESQESNVIRNVPFGLADGS